MEGVVKSAGRVLEIFEFFAHRYGPATVSEVAAALGFPLSSTSVLLKSLLALGYLEYEPRAREYQPTIRFAVLGTWIFERLFADEEEIPRLMDELQAETGETSCWRCRRAGDAERSERRLHPRPPVDAPGALLHQARLAPPDLAPGRRQSAPGAA
jgi:DNA-binding IclR family transcriptional regulator